MKIKYYIIRVASFSSLWLFCAGMVMAATPTVTPSASPSVTPSQTATFTCTPFITPSETQSITITPTVTRTPVEIIIMGWQEDFIGTPGEKPLGWDDNTIDTSFNLYMEYSNTFSCASITKTAQDKWGKVMTKKFGTEISFYSWLKINVTELSEDMKWRLIIRWNGDNQYIDSDEPYGVSKTGVLEYDLKEIFNREKKEGYLNENIIGPVRIEFILEQTTQEGKSGKAEIDYIQLYYKGADVTPTPIPAHPSTLNMSYYTCHAEASEIVVFQDRVYVAWSEENITAQSPQIYVKRLSSSNFDLVGSSEDWELVGEKIGQRTGAPSLTADDTFLYLAYAQYINDMPPQTTVKKFDGANWSDVGNPWNSGGNPDIAVLNNQPIVAWAIWHDIEENKGIHIVNVLQFTGSEWESIGSDINLSSSACVAYPCPRLAVHNNTPYVTWFEQYAFSGDDYEYMSTTHIKLLNERGWEQLGKQFSGCRKPVIALSNAGTAVLAWEQLKDPHKSIYARVWNDPDQNWDQLARFVEDDEKDNAYNPDLCLMNETSYIIGTQNKEEYHELFFKYWNGKEWDKVAEQINKRANRDAINPSISAYMDVGKKIGHIFISWSEKNTHYINQLYVEHYEVPPISTPTPFVSKVPTYAIPNPFLPLLGQKAVFCFDTSQSTEWTIRIMTMEGRIIRRLSNILEWDGRSDRGHLCEGGLYIYQIQAGSKRMSGTIVLLK
jgi:hypothetical protein